MNTVLRLLLHRRVPAQLKAVVRFQPKRQRRDSQMAGEVAHSYCSLDYAGHTCFSRSRCGAEAAESIQMHDVDDLSSTNDMGSQLWMLISHNMVKSCEPLTYILVCKCRSSIGNQHLRWLISWGIAAPAMSKFYIKRAWTLACVTTGPAIFARSALWRIQLKSPSVSTNEIESLIS